MRDEGDMIAGPPLSNRRLIGWTLTMIAVAYVGIVAALVLIGG